MKVYVLVDEDKELFDDGNGYKAFETIAEAKDAKSELSVPCDICVANLEIVRLVDFVEDE